MLIAGLFALLVAAQPAAAASAPPAVPASHAIAIVINGNALPIEPAPRFEGSILFVPVRRTLEALGLPFDRNGNRITTQVGSKAVEVDVGSRSAQIDGNRVMLDAPTVEIGSVLYAPLRFITDVLGAQASYDKRTKTVTIVAQLIGRADAGLVATGSGFTRLGNVAAVDVLSDPPTLTLGYATGPKTIPIAPNAVVEVEDVSTNVTMPGELGDIRAGDFARVEMRKDGRVERIVDAYGSRSGRVVAVASNQLVLDSGQVISSGRTTEVALNGKGASFADLQPGDSVTVRYNVESNEVREVLASRRESAAAAPGASSAHITDVVVDSNHALRAGDSVGVVLHGTPGGAATFDIGSFVANQAMHETSSGTYAGSYTIPRGANFDQAPVIGRLTMAGGGSAQAQAAQAISASSTPPGIADFAPDAGVTVNADRPAIFATFAADAVPVNPSGVQLWVNGREVTDECVRTAQFIQCLPSYSYPQGPVHVTVRVADRAGNTTTKSWTFTIKR